MSRLLYVVVAIIAITSADLADARSHDDATDGKVERRGFKSSLLSTARGFGKRSSPISRIPEEMMPIPLDVVAEQVIRDPKLLAVIFQTLDTDDDGMVTPDEVAITQEKYMAHGY